MNTLRSLVVSSIRSTTKRVASSVVTKAQTHTPPHSPVEVQAVAGRPLLPHVYVLPHGAVAAAQHRADSSTSQTHPQFGPRRCNHQRSPPPPSHPLLTGQKLSAKQKLSKRWALADCSHHCCLPACLPHSVFIMAFPPLPLPMLCLAGPPDFGATAGQTRAAFANKRSSVLAVKITLDFERRRMFCR